MHEFIAKHQDKIIGRLSAFDRLVFRKKVRSIAHTGGDDALPGEMHPLDRPRARPLRRRRGQRSETPPGGRADQTQVYLIRFLGQAIWCCAATP